MKRLAMTLVLLLQIAESDSAVVANSVGAPSTAGFSLDREQRLRLPSLLGQIKVGDTPQRVRDVMGRPNRDEELFDKRGKFSFRVLEFDVQRIERTNANIYDKIIVFYFDKAGRLMRISSPRNFD